jgi:CspA family cold shock protein
MSKGTVKFFNDAKGYGFITEDGSQEDHFVHISGLIDEVREGDVVEFELQQGKKGLNAVNVKVID